MKCQDNYNILGNGNIATAVIDDKIRPKNRTVFDSDIATMIHPVANTGDIIMIRIFFPMVSVTFPPIGAKMKTKKHSMDANHEASFSFKSRYGIATVGYVHTQPYKHVTIENVTAPKICDKISGT